ncbi:unnamed protein product [Rhizophagus irregularis]|nr:unnamed protein product [Rhizophagus irregularis]
MSRNEEFSEKDLIKFEVRQKALIESTTKSVKQKVGQLSSKLYDICFSAFENHLEIFQQLEILNPLQLEGMENLLDSLNKLKDDILLDKVDSFIRLYKSATIKSADIIHADPSYNKVPWFSDVAIVMDTTNATNYTTVCFGKVSKVASTDLDVIFKC